MIKAEKIEECSAKVADKVIGCVARREDADTVIWRDSNHREIAVLFEDENGEVHFSFTKNVKNI